MDRREEQANVNRYQEDLQKLKDQKIDDSKMYIEEDGHKYRLPYKMIKKVEFYNVKQEDMIDHPHAARLQYRLMLLDPVIKAFVEYTREKITVIYNPSTAENIREKMSLEELIKFLEKEGVHIDRSTMVESDYDYHKEFYNYAFNPKVIREHPPYGYTKEQWKKMKPEWEKKMEEYKIKKFQNHKNFQKAYEEQHPEVYGNLEQKAPNNNAKVVMNKEQKDSTVKKKGIFKRLQIFNNKKD